MAVTEVDAMHAVHWMQPDDTIGRRFLTELLGTAKQHPHVGGAQVLFADGTKIVHSSKCFAGQASRALTTIAGQGVIENLAD